MTVYHTKNEHEIDVLKITQRDLNVSLILNDTTVHALETAIKDYRESQMIEYTVPVFDPETGDEWDVDVEAKTPISALNKVGDKVDTNVHIEPTFIDEHFDEVDVGEGE